MLDFERTRQSLGRQLAAALDADQGIACWTMVSEWNALRYIVHADDQGHSHTFTPGECANWLNARGFDVRIGKR